MRKVLVAVDGTPASMDALSWGRGLAAAQGDASVEVVSVLDPGPVDGPAGPEMLEALRWERTAALAAWTGGCPAGLEECVRLLEGEPGAALAGAVVRRSSGLVVVGADGTHGRMGPRLGRVATHLAYHVDVPLLIVPVGRRWHGLRQVVVGVDGSDGAQAAVEFVARLGASFGAAVDAVYAPPPFLDGANGPNPKGWGRSAARDLACWTAPLGHAPVTLRPDVRLEGHPSLAILSAAEESDADLVVVGTRATNRVTRSRLSNVAFQLLHHATRPTLVVPPRSTTHRTEPHRTKTQTAPTRTAPTGGSLLSG
jgi:nucleotide-binding universal stress UspA family protein